MKQTRTTASRAATPQRSATASATASPQTAASTSPAASLQPPRYNIELADLGVQPKLTIGAVHDPHEREADEVAERVMRMSAPAAGPLGGATRARDRLQRACARCTEEDAVLRRKDTGTASGTVPAIVYDVLRSPGKPLDVTTRAFMEPRFGRTFDQVRIHDDTRAAASAQAIQALAYTSGPHIVFDAGRYAPGSAAEQRLLAHELAHTVQQGFAPPIAAPAQYARPASPAEAPATPTAHGSVTGRIQRSCGRQAIGTPAGCEPSETEAPERPRYLFRVSCDEFLEGNELDLRADAAAIAPGDTVEIHGLASEEGPADFNVHLSCARARRARTVINEVLTRRSITARIELYSHGAQTGGARAADRAVAIIRHAAQPQPQPQPRCGPDVTAWFVRQVNRAMSDPTVLSIRTMLRPSSATLLVPSSAAHFGDVADAGALAAVLVEEQRLGRAAPPRHGAIVGQIAAGERSAFRAGAYGLLDPSGALAAATVVGGAALLWRSLVNHGAPYDFKAHILHMLRSGRCPEDPCPAGEHGTITLCPGSGMPENCYESDLPGNLFYALIGRYAGFTELTLQLGSQYAELTDRVPRPARPMVTWDSPEDTLAIRLGYRLPLPLTVSALCGVLAANRPSLSIRTGCADCPDVPRLRDAR